MDEMYRERLKDLSEIRNLMEQSTKFVSLSGLSGVAAGIVALAGAYVANEFLYGQGLVRNYLVIAKNQAIDAEINLVWQMVGLGVLILIVAMVAASFFSIRKARQQSLPIWNKTAQRLMLNLMIPLAVGAVFCFQLAWYGLIGLVAPATLVFYGLALLNAGKYTLREIRYLGLSEIALGLISGFVPGYGLIFWAVGFGLLHILYGIVMYFKYER